MRIVFIRIFNTLNIYLLNCYVPLGLKYIYLPMGRVVLLYIY
jgi:hypothetical protein